MAIFSRNCIDLYFSDGGIMKYKHLKNKIKELEDRLNMANSTVAIQIKAFDDMCKHYESQLKVQDNELSRRLVIIHYLESKCMKGFE